ncbi:phosphopantetheine-binding protein [Streptomyces agglomeratus]|uniref:phosphopantetheine-binding protein n=1 Tax=Streptomyces agglomeratus TaxID=285458 RepID=UPI000854622A|nr:acyl carrier protein [Streptomyces agglomeratus]OEJ36234.1 phosphopantetheine-binding protein [Streptomyces agglomeratus]
MAWDQQFENLLRECLPFLGPDEELTPDTSLRDAGLDSLGTVELLGSLESAYDVRFVDEALSLDTFATPAVLWATLTKMSEAATT